jgi:hypothetical protein
MRFFKKGTVLRANDGTIMGTLARDIVPDYHEVISFTDILLPLGGHPAGSIGPKMVEAIRRLK